MKSINSIDLKTAVSHIKQVCDDSREANERLPFFFLVGAGISHPPIPLAAEIEKNCMAVAHNYGRGSEPVAKRSIATYSHWFEQAHPQPAQRQKYLRKLIEGYIAFLLGNKDKAREILTRAIAMGGEEIRQGEFRNADIHPLPQDEEFKDLVRSIPAPPTKES